jgi:hypothetical protein
VLAVHIEHAIGDDSWHRSDYRYRVIREFYEASGGFGTLLIATGKDWATREKRARSMKLFMEHVAPQLRDLEPVREPGKIAA